MSSNKPPSRATLRFTFYGWAVLLILGAIGVLKSSHNPELRLLALVAILIGLAMGLGAWLGGRHR